MSKTSLTFRELIELIDTSVKSGKIVKDYPDFLKSFRDLGISSYILNTIIMKAKESSNKDDIGQESVVYSYFVLSEPQKDMEDDEYFPKAQAFTKVEKKNSKLVWLLIGCCVVETLFLYSIYEDKKSYCERFENANIKNIELRNTIATIFNMTSNISDDSSFSNWHSSNHEKSSESHNTYSFTASKGDKLSFNYYVSSEQNFDCLTITLSGDSISSKELVKISGVSNASRVFVFKKDGKYDLQVKYSKDSSIDKHNDNAGVSNICLYRNHKSILENIHSISGGSITKR